MESPDSASDEDRVILRHKACRSLLVSCVFRNSDSDTLWNLAPLEWVPDDPYPLNGPTRSLFTTDHIIDLEIARVAN